MNAPEEAPVEPRLDEPADMEVGTDALQELLTKQPTLRKNDVQRDKWDLSAGEVKSF